MDGEAVGQLRGLVRKVCSGHNVPNSKNRARVAVLFKLNWGHYRKAIRLLHNGEIICRLLRSHRFRGYGTTCSFANRSGFEYTAVACLLT